MQANMYTFLDTRLGKLLLSITTELSGEIQTDLFVYKTLHAASFSVYHVQVSLVICIPPCMHSMNRYHSQRDRYEVSNG